MIKLEKRTMLAAASICAALALASPAAAQNAQAGITAWQAGDHEAAVRIWRPLAERGDPDAMFNLGHAYRAGRGVPQDMRMAEQFYGRAARAGHEEAVSIYGLLLFQNGRREEAMPWVRRAAEAGDPRAQYVLGTAMFNGDVVEQDRVRAYALMSRAAAQGLPPARTQLEEIERHLSADERRRGTELARTMERGAPAQTTEAPPRTHPPRVAGAQPPRLPAEQPRRDPLPPAARPAPAQPAPAPAATPATGRWRVQLGAFSSEANARRAWAQARSRVSGLSGLQSHLVRAGNLTRLQAGPLPSRAAAERLCASARSAGQACFPVGP